VQRYLEFTGAAGKPQVWNYRLRLRGALCNGPDDKMDAHVNKSALATTAAIGLCVKHACGFAAAVVARRLLWHNWEVE